MIVKTKQVFYCSHCRKHGLSRAAMEKHERYCTMNPARRCRWHLLDDMPSTRMLSSGVGAHGMRRGLPRWVRIFAPITEERLRQLREHALGCPACMLAAVRQSDIDSFARDRFDYGAEIKRYREEEREHWWNEASLL